MSTEKPNHGLKIDTKLDAGMTTDIILPHALSFESHLPVDSSLKANFKCQMQPRSASPEKLSTTPSPTSTTTYHIYKTESSHALITIHSLPKSLYSRCKYLKKNPDALSAPSTLTSAPSPNYFLHLPKQAFRCPPRTLRRGAAKTSPPLCIVHNSPWWRKWRILTGSDLMGAIDPRGLVSWHRRSSRKNSPTGEAEVKGYKVRRWRFGGESGKQFYRGVEEDRRCRARDLAHDQGHTQYLVKEEDRAENKAFANELKQTADEEMKTGSWDPVLADEVIPVTWTNPSPFSKRVRWYRFWYKGVKATWKGSRNIPANKMWGRRLMPVHHLKLIAELPDTQYLEGKDRGDDLHQEVVLARYSSSLSGGKYGTLTIFDEEVRRVFASQRMKGSRQGFGDKDAGVMDEYDVIVATAMCMVLGEWQKRKTVLEILLALLGAGAEGGSSMA